MARLLSELSSAARSRDSGRQVITSTRNCEPFATEFPAVKLEGKQFDPGVISATDLPPANLPISCHVQINWLNWCEDRCDPLGERV